MEHVVNDLKNKIAEEEEKDFEDKQLAAKLESEKKPPELIFKELLYHDSNMNKLSTEIWSKLKEDQDVSKKIQSEITNAPEVVKIMEWYNDEMAA